MNLETDKNRLKDKPIKQGIKFYFIKNLIKNDSENLNIPEHLVCKHKNIRN